LHFSTMAEILESHRNPVTLTRFLMMERNQYREATGNFSMLLQSVQLACKVIANANAKAGIANLYGMDGNTNSSGDAQKKLDVFSNDVFINCLSFSKQVYIMGSEENEEPIILQDQTGGYAIVFDPLDGSSNIDANVSVGTIFGIYKKDKKKTTPTSVDCLLRPGTDLICAGYCLYGPAVMLVLTTGLGVNGFTLDPTLGEFILTSQNIRIPRQRCSYYSINEGNYEDWDEPTKAYVDECKQPQKHLNGKPMKGRYIGSMVADVHRTLLYGGIFSYPGTSKDPDGKLRLLYEGNPMAFLVEQAGGRATTGTERIMELQPKSLHCRTPIWLGSADMVQDVENLYKKPAKL